MNLNVISAYLDGLDDKEAGNFLPTKIAEYDSEMLKAWSDAQQENETLN